SYNATITTRLLNEAWRPSVTMDANGNPAPTPIDWYPVYGQAFLANKLAGQSDQDAHNNARLVADQGRPAPGSAEFKQLFEQVRSIPIPKGGLFVDKSDLYQIEGQYNLTEFTKSVADILVGG